MLLPVMINGVRLIVLLDSGSTHNFLSVATMRRLGLHLSDAEQLSVTVANGDRLACQGMARQVPILIGDEHFSINCIGIDLGCFDFILGVDFMRTLGPILWDFDARTLIFWRLGRRIRWEGIGGAAPTAP
jgi:predicted aspartyl protease